MSSLFSSDPTSSPFLLPRQPMFPPLPKEQEDSLLSKLGEGALSGLGYVGSLIDKYTGARGIRGLLDGRPEELLSIIPGSDKLGITDEQNSVTGKQLLQDYGVLDKNDDSWTGTLAGIGADLATSPATYLSFGGSALTKAGNVAEKIGALPGSTAGRIAGYASAADVPAAAVQAAGRAGINLADIVGTPLGGIAKAKIPFTPFEATLGTGAGGQAVLDTLGSVGQGASWLAHNTPGVSQVTDFVEPKLEALGRYGRRLFDYSVGGAASELGQRYGRQFTGGVEQGLNDLRGVEGGLIRDLHGANVLDQGEQLRGVGEGTLAGVGPQGQALENATVTMQSHLGSLDAEGQQLGFAPQQLQDSEIEYLPRHSRPLTRQTLGFAPTKRALPLQQAAFDAREEFLKDIPGGTNILNQMTVDPDLSGIAGRFQPGQFPTNRMQRAADIRGRYLGVSPADEARIPQIQAAQAAGLPLTPQDELLLGRVNQSQQLTKYLEGMDPAHLSEQSPLFGNHPVEDFLQTAAAKVKRNEAGKAVHDLFAEVAVPEVDAAPGSVSYLKALETAGFTDPGASQAAAAAKLSAKTGTTVTPSDLTKMYIPPEAMADATRFMQGIQVPEALRPLVSAIDSVTNLYKSFQTAIWPSFHSRNFISGQWMNWLIGASDPRFAKLNPRAWAQPVLDAQSLIRGGAVEGAGGLPMFAGRALSDDQATAIIADLAHQYRVVTHGVHQAADLTGAGEGGAELAARIPGMQPFQGFLPTAKQGVTGLFQGGHNPLGVAQVGGYNRDTFAPLIAGRQIGTAVEDTNRLSGFIAKLRQGFDPEAAATQIRAAHVDYQNLTPFEKTVMRRVAPFYTYSRGIVPQVLQNLIEEPGGLAGSWAQASNEIRQDNHNFVPPYLGNGLAIPVGQEDNGTQRFLTQIDTPVETASRLLANSPGGTLSELAGQTNPLIKLPIELATGKQLYSGRDLADLYPITGSTVVDELLANSPVSKVLTTARQVMDPRKDLFTDLVNFGTGARLSDVDMEKQRDLAAKDMIAQMLRGEPGVHVREEPTVRREDFANLSPADVLLMRLNAGIEQRGRQKVKQNIGVRS